MSKKDGNKKKAESALTTLAVRKSRAVYIREIADEEGRLVVFVTDRVLELGIEAYKKLNQVEA
jgi:hypothetical protein